MIYGALWCGAVLFLLRSLQVVVSGRVSRGTRSGTARLKQPKVEKVKTGREITKRVGHCGSTARCPAFREEVVRSVVP